MRKRNITLALVAATLVVACGSASDRPIDRVVLTVGQGPQGAVGLRIAVRADHGSFEPGHTVAHFEDAGITVTRLDVWSENWAELVIDIPRDEAPGRMQLVVTTGDVVVRAAFEVISGPGVVAVPGTFEVGAGVVPMDLVGIYTHFGAPGAGVRSLLPGVSVLGAELVGDDHLRVNVHVGPDAAIGHHPNALAVDTDYQTVPVGLTIVGQPVPSISVSPSEVEQGTSVPITLLASETRFDLNPALRIPDTMDVEVVDLVRVSDTEVTGTLWAYSDATVGAYTLEADTDAGTLATVINVAEASTTPALTTDVSVVYQGTQRLISVLGEGTHFAAGATVVAANPLGAGVFFELVDVMGPEWLRVRVLVDDDAIAGNYAIEVETGLERAQTIMQVLPKPKITLDPNRGHQGQTVLVTVEGRNTNFDQANTEVETEVGAGLTATDILVQGPELLTMQLVISDDAELRKQRIVVRTGTEEVKSRFRVRPGQAEITLTPPDVPQNSESVVITADARFFTFVDGQTTVTPRNGCQAVVESVQVLSPTQLEVTISVPIWQLEGPCRLRFQTDGQGRVDVELNITSGATDIGIPDSVTGMISDDTLYRLNLEAGQVVKLRATRAVWTSVDPVLSIYDATLTLIGENDDESAATYNSLIVWQARDSGSYYLRVRDRFGLNDGEFTLDTGLYEPESELEMTPITAADDNNDREDATVIRPGGVGSVLVRGRFQRNRDRRDVYRIGTIPGERLTIAVLGQDVSPYAESTPDTILRTWQAEEGRWDLQETLGLEGPDPLVYATPNNAEYFARVRREGGTQRRTGYWLNVRPWVVINEVVHDEALDWEASFVELHGEPGAAMTGCELLGEAHDAALGQTTPAFSIDLGAFDLGPWGYLVIAHDALVPGTGGAFINIALSVNDPGGVYTTIAISLVCNGNVVDAVCYRGTELPVCEGAAAPDTPGVAIGRGFHLDSDDNARDFIVQLEPSPWARNTREVP